MGSGPSTAASPSSVCQGAREEVRVCKAEIGLGLNECYPRDYRGECDAVELKLKKCLAFKLCNGRGDAAAFYDMSRPRAERVAANKEMQVCLRKRKAMQECVPRAN